MKGRSKMNSLWGSGKLLCGFFGAGSASLLRNELSVRKDVHCPTIQLSKVLGRNLSAMRNQYTQVGEIPKQGEIALQGKIALPVGEIAKLHGLNSSARRNKQIFWKKLFCRKKSLCQEKQFPQEKRLCYGYYSSTGRNGEITQLGEIALPGKKRSTG